MLLIPIGFGAAVGVVAMNLSMWIAGFGGAERKNETEEEMETAEIANARAKKLAEENKRLLAIVAAAKECREMQRNDEYLKTSITRKKRMNAEKKLDAEIEKREKALAPVQEELGI